MSAAAGYRTAGPDDLPSLRALWAGAFAGTDVTALWATDPGRFGRTFVAVRDERVVAAVHYLPRRIRAAEGAVDLVGGVANVATHPPERGRGHARRLLDRAVTAMTADGCAWALLFTGTPAVYRSSGFRTFRLGYTSGRPAPPSVAAPQGWTVRPGSWADWPALAALHRGFNAHRPLSTVRGDHDWRHRVPTWYAPPAELLVAHRHGEPAGYLVRERSAGLVRVLEVAGGVDALRVLFGAVAATARVDGAEQCVARLPADPVVRTALPWLLRDPLPEVDETGMVRPLRADAARLAATTGAPGAFHWPGDYL
ncbi:Acetyltransferase (GNAT) domain-containing protein [Micromonospora pallida]|uniref:Acetyltransferase (GNAT) domain-containing protein n=1 Tax=Micromonospora pallida TaxID=145854 RepID=A0A1C6S6Z9_9ACTN|nr:GNAT family N-acetyltransferase [Micromonospora pallida]SCL25047.1 Acetyltransferase (GNAT) domain-containing protein [Micromonospora pallida]